MIQTIEMKMKLAASKRPPTQKELNDKWEEDWKQVVANHRTTRPKEMISNLFGLLKLKSKGISPLAETVLDSEDKFKAFKHNYFKIL